MRLVLAAALAAFIPAVSVAQESWSSYDSQSGNRYNNYSDGYGNTTTRGYNSRTGARWTITQNEDGTYRGRDADGNSFRGDNNTGRYYNYGTGVMCYGLGSARTCY